jgi:uncharacterized protein YhbP (UPF0306 family)
MTVATAGPDGQPHAAAVYFACDEDLNFYFFSDPDSQHSQDLTTDGRAARDLPECRDWHDIRGLQLRGTIRGIDQGLPGNRAGIVTRQVPVCVRTSGIVARNQPYVFNPIWIRFIDNRVRLGFKQEWVREPVEGRGLDAAGVCHLGTRHLRRDRMAERDLDKAALAGNHLMSGEPGRNDACR